MNKSWQDEIQYFEIQSWFRETGTGSKARVRQNNVYRLLFLVLISASVYQWLFPLEPSTGIKRKLHTFKDRYGQVEPTKCSTCWQDLTVICYNVFPSTFLCRLLSIHKRYTITKTERIRSTHQSDRQHRQESKWSSYAQRPEIREFHMVDHVLHLVRPSK